MSDLPHGDPMHVGYNCKECQDQPPKLYTNNKTIATELGKMYPGVEIVTTPGNYPTQSQEQGNDLADERHKPPQSNANPQSIAGIRGEG